MFKDLISLIFNKNIFNRKIDFAFILHPKDAKDIFIKYPFLKIFPHKVIDFFLLYFWPHFVGKIKIDNHIGIFIVCPMTARQMLHNRKRSAKRVLTAAKLASIYGAKTIGLGALSSVVTDGGQYVKNHLNKDIAITSGNSLTAFISANDVIDIVKKNNAKGSIAIVGATGSIGKAIYMLLAKSLENKLILIGKDEERTKNLSDLTTNKNIVTSTDINTIKEAEFIVVATSAVGATIHRDILDNTKYVYDLTQPKNTSKEIQDLNTIKYFDGGLVKRPDNVDFNLKLPLPKGVMFSCLAETIILSLSGKGYLCSSKDLIIENVEEVGNLSRKYSFESIVLNK